METMTRNQIDTIATERIATLFGAAHVDLADEASGESVAKINGASLDRDADRPLVRWYTAAELAWLDDGIVSAFPSGAAGAWAIGDGFVSPEARRAAGLLDDGTVGDMEPPLGYVERAVERARRDGVLE